MRIPTLPLPESSSPETVPQERKHGEDQEDNEEYLRASQDKFATPANPKKPAIRAMTRNTIASRSMIKFSFTNSLGPSWRIASTARD